jgi:hypothetical protein
MFDYPVFNSEEEAQKAREFPLLPDGIYDFAVIDAKPGFTNSGNPKINLKLRIIHQEKEWYVFDDLIGMPSFAWKIKHFCEITGLEKEYKAKQFGVDMCKNRRGKCKISNIAAKPKNDGTNDYWKAKNQVDDYVINDKTNIFSSLNSNPFVPNEAKSKITPSKEAKAFEDDDIPF